DGGGFVSNGHNLVGTGLPGATATDIVGVDALLGLLRDNGGPTPTVMPAVGSPALDAGGANCAVTDQRGVPRPQGAACDIGAVEACEGATDRDADGWADACDNCPAVANADQADADADGRGDACDPCPAGGAGPGPDADGDGVSDACDDCPSWPNAFQRDAD